MNALFQTIGSNNGGNLMTKAQAAKVAKAMSDSDPDWSFTVEDRGEWAVVVIRDEDGEILGAAPSA
jgi:hypothetical protein